MSRVLQKYSEFELEKLTLVCHLLQITMMIKVGSADINLMRWPLTETSTVASIANDLLNEKIL